MSMHSPSLPSLVCLVLLTPPVLWADTIVLKSGERLDAKISRTTETTVEAEVKMSASVTDIRVIQKADIASIEKPDPSEEAFATAKAAGPGANSRSVADYNAIIYNQLNAFVTRYPDSPRVPEVKELIAALEKEKERVALGEVKLENTWYTPAEVEKQKDQINSILQLQQIKNVAQNGDTLGALNLYTKLEKTYPGTRAYPAAVDYALQLLPAVQSEINTKKAILANDMIERKKGLDVLPDFRKAPLLAAAASEEARANAAVAAAIKSGVKWTPIYPRNAKSIEELQKTLTAEATRLATIRTAPMYASIAAVAEARQQIASGDYAGATATATKATSLWSANLMLKDLAAELALAKATPSPTATPAPNPVGPHKAAPSTAAPLPSAAPTTASAPAAPLVAITPIPPPAPVPEESPAFLTTIPGALTVLAIAAVIAGGISLVLKSKNKDKPLAE